MKCNGTLRILAILVVFGGVHLFGEDAGHANRQRAEAVITAFDAMDGIPWHYAHLREYERLMREIDTLTPEGIDQDTAGRLVRIAKTLYDRIDTLDPAPGLLYTITRIACSAGISPGDECYTIIRSMMLNFYNTIHDDHYRQYAASLFRSGRDLEKIGLVKYAYTAYQQGLKLLSKKGDRDFFAVHGSGILDAIIKKNEQGEYNSHVLIISTDAGQLGLYKTGLRGLESIRGRMGNLNPWVERRLVEYREKQQ